MIEVETTILVRDTIEDTIIRSEKITVPLLVGSLKTYENDIPLEVLHNLVRVRCESVSNRHGRTAAMRLAYKFLLDDIQADIDMMAASQSDPDEPSFIAEIPE